MSEFIILDMRDAFFNIMSKALSVIINAVTEHITLIEIQIYRRDSERICDYV